MTSLDAIPFEAIDLAYATQGLTDFESSFGDAPDHFYEAVMDREADLLYRDPSIEANDDVDLYDQLDAWYSFWIDRSGQARYDGPRPGDNPPGRLGS